MAYYSKEEVLNYVESSLEEISKKGIEPLTPKEEAVMRLENEEDMVGFFWISYNEEGEDTKVSMEGKAFVRIDHDIYTDDRFAIDLYESAKNECTVSDIIRKREQEKELAKQGIVDKAALEKKVKENIKKDGA